MSGEELALWEENIECSYARESATGSVKLIERVQSQSKTPHHWPSRPRRPKR